jgi:phage gpG-like protein
MVTRIKTGTGLLIDSDLLQFAFKPSLGMVAREIDKLGLNIKSFREPFKRAIQQVVAPSFGENFAAGGRPAWEPLADDTLKIKEAAGQDNGILVRSGLLKRTIQQLNIWTINTTSASLRSLPDKIGYGVVHQAGTGGFAAFKQKIQAEDPGASIRDILIEIERKGAAAAKVRIPQREFVMLQQEDYPKIDKVFSTWLEERMLAAFGSVKL